MSSKLISKKEMKRNSKALLLKIGKEGGLQVSKKMTKNMIVDMLFKNKSIRKSMKVPPKKPPTPAQLKARKAFTERMKKGKSSSGHKSGHNDNNDKNGVTGHKVRSPIEQPSTSAVNIKSKVKIDPTASNKLEPPPKTLKETPRQSTQFQKMIASTAPKLNIKTDKTVVERQIIGKIPIIEQTQHKKESGRLIATDFKFSSIIKTKANKNATLLLREMDNYNDFVNVRRRTHIDELRSRMKVNTKNVIGFLKLDLSSNSKTDDRIDRKIRNGITLQNNQKIKRAMNSTERTEDKDFGDLEEIIEEIAITDEENPLSKIMKMLLLRQEFLEKVGDNPQLQPELELELEEALLPEKELEEPLPIEEEEEEEKEEEEEISSLLKNVLFTLRKKDMVRILQENKIEIPEKGTKKVIFKIFIKELPSLELEKIGSDIKNVKKETDLINKRQLETPKSKSAISESLESEILN